MPSRQSTMSSQLDNVSTILGEYMLKGWTLTDLQCSTCHISPLMREPAAQASAAGRTRIQFCAFCDGSPEGHTPPNAPTPTLTQATPQTAQPAVEFDSPLDPHPPLSSSGSTQSLSLRERPPSAPPTRALPSTPFSPDNAAGTTRSNPSSIRSSILSPAFVPRPLPQVETGNKSSEEVSEIISQRLLQGYSLLQTNCPNSLCRGVPLIGYPRAKDGSRDPRRTCVSCGTGYVSEGAMGGMKTVQPEAGPSQTSGTSGTREAKTVTQSTDMESLSATMPESPRSKKRREMYETGEAINNTLRPASNDLVQTEQSIEPKSTQEEDDLDLPAPTDPTTSTILSPRSGISTSLERVTSSLALTLDRLSESLASHTTGRGEAGEARYFVDVKLHTEAMRDVLEVLERVRRVQ